MTPENIIRRAWGNRSVDAMEGRETLNVPIPTPVPVDVTGYVPDSLMVDKVVFKRELIIISPLNTTAYIAVGYYRDTALAVDGPSDDIIAWYNNGGNPLD